VIVPGRLAAPSFAIVSDGWAGIGHETEAAGRGQCGLVCVNIPAARGCRDRARLGMVGRQ
jgi:hypothetical protein